MSQERDRETWELENFPTGEEQEMVELFEEKGYTSEQAKQVKQKRKKRRCSKQESLPQLVNILATHKGAFVQFMMVEELGILPSPSSRVRQKDSERERLLILLVSKSIWVNSLLLLFGTVVAGKSGIFRWLL